MKKHCLPSAAAATSVREVLVGNAAPWPARAHQLRDARRLATAVQELVREAGARRVDHVVEGIDRNLLLRPEDDGGRDLEGRGG